MHTDCPFTAASLQSKYHKLLHKDKPWGSGLGGCRLGICHHCIHSDLLQLELWLRVIWEVVYVFLIFWFLNFTSSEDFPVLWYKISFEPYLKKCNYSQLFIMSIKLFHVNIWFLSGMHKVLLFFLFSRMPNLTMTAHFLKAKLFSNDISFVPVQCVNTSREEFSWLVCAFSQWIN